MNTKAEVSAENERTAIAGFLREQRQKLTDFGFRNPAIALGDPRSGDRLELFAGKYKEVVEKIQGDGRFELDPEFVIGGHDADGLLTQLEHIRLESEEIASDVGLSLLKLGLGAVVWKDQDGKEREGPALFQPVRIEGACMIADGPVEDNESLLAHLEAVGLEIEISRSASGSSGVVVRSDPHSIFVGWKDRMVLGVFATMKLALAQSLDEERRPFILDAGALRTLALPYVRLEDWTVQGQNQNVVPADPGQDAVILAARYGRSFVVQGPPGTGKSQTIVNVAANLAHDGRRVLIAAEKVAAIEVVSARLAKAGVAHRLIVGRSDAGGPEPIVLTTPAVAARFLPPEESFDYLVIDEAGQAPLPNAASLATRAQRMLIVGDCMQMGPNLRAYVPTAKAERTPRLSDVLTRALDMGLPEMRLTHHYRSQHPDLIFPSDTLSYGGSLMTSPSPAFNRSTGLFLHLVEGATVDEASSGVVNRFEAAEIVKMIDRVSETGDRFSVGVVLMNEAQRDLVSRMAHREFAKSGRSLQEAFTVPGEPLFIRTIDAVQGEERDLIIVGMTYGRKADGQLPRTLGPFSSPTVRAKLNVGLSRSRKQCMVVTSLREGDLESARLASHAWFATVLTLAQARTAPLYLPKGHPLADLARRRDCLVEVKEGVFCIRTNAEASGYLIGIYLKGLRGADEDAAEISRLKAMGWRLEVFDASDALETSRHEDFFASWKWPFGTFEFRLERLRPRA